VDSETRRLLKDFDAWRQDLIKNFRDPVAGWLHPSGYPMSWDTGETQEALRGAGLIQSDPGECSTLCGGVFASHAGDSLTNTADAVRTGPVPPSSTPIQLPLPGTPFTSFTVGKRRKGRVSRGFYSAF
jgi:hypothetical protein